MGTYALTRRLASFGEGNPLHHPDLFYVGLLNAGGGTMPAQGGHEELFLERDICCWGGALVAWSTVCRPVAHGGLGVRHFQHQHGIVE